MMNNDPSTNTFPDKARVSIFERIVPFGSFALAAVGGGIGGWLIISLMEALRHEENVGIGTVARGLAEYTWFPLGFLYASAALGVVAICVALGRLVIDTKTASPSGISYIVLGILSLVPLALVWRAGSTIISVLDGSSKEGIGELGATVAQYCVLAMIAAPTISVVLLAWSLIPFRSRPGRRFGPLIALVLMEIALIAVAVMFQIRIAELWRIYAA